jgi:UDP:flavonoid glycosyltransferase YjiC (YdhE family)
MGEVSSSRKRTVLIFPFELLSSYLRSIELAKLIKEDFDVKILHSEKLGKFIKENGFSTFEGLNFDSDKVIQTVKKFSFRWLDKKVISILIENHREIIRKYNPAFVISDTLPTIRISAQKEGVPNIAILNGYMSKYFSLQRPVPSSHLGNKFRKLMPEKIFNRIAKEMESLMFRIINKPFSEIREKLKLGKVENYLDELEGDITLICDLPDLYPQNNLPDNFFIIGPIIYRGNSSDKEMRVINSLDKNRKTILVTVGSTGDIHFYSILKDKAFKDFNIIFTGASESFIHQENIIYVDFLSIPSVINHVDLVLTHGGNGSIYQSLAGGVPVLCKPNIFEQEWNVHRIVEMGLGEWLPNSISKTELRKIIEKWIDKARKGKLAEISDKIKNYQEKMNDALRKVIGRILK